MKNFFTFLIIILLISCEREPSNFFPSSVGLKWLYSIKISSSYTGKEYEKRLMVTNIDAKKKNNKLDLSKLNSDGSFYTYQINFDNNQVIRSSAVLAFDEGMVEPVKKIIYPDIFFKKNEWIIKEQLFLIKGFQPPLRNVKPRKKFDMKYEIFKRLNNFRFNGEEYKNCIEIKGVGNTSFIGDTRSGPINVDIINNELVCDGVGIIKQKRIEKTNASAFGNMTFEKKLLTFKK